jgi:integrase
VKRKRQQTGTIFQARGFWYVRYFEDRVEKGALKHARVAKQLSPVTTRGKRPPKEIEDEAKAKVAEANITNKTPDRVLTFADFMEQVYLPHIEKFKRASTVNGYKDIWKLHLQPRCAGQWLKDVRTFHVQGWLDSMAKPGKLGRNTLRHIKTFISAVFKLAKQQGYYLNENPVRDTAISPKAPQPQETYAYSLDEIQAILAVLPERAAAVFAVAAFAGLRRSELQGLLWENYQDGEIRVTRAIWEGHVSDPKTERSKGAVPVIKQLAARLDMYRLRCGNPQNGPMFANSKKNPQNLNNVLNREILPALERCEHCRKNLEDHGKADHDFKRDDSLPKWHGWHAARRGLGSNLYALGVPEKVIQSILRHANVSTTVTYYVKTRDEQAAQAMAKLEDALPETLTVN